MSQPRRAVVGDRADVVATLVRAFLRDPVAFELDHPFRPGRYIQLTLPGRGRKPDA